MAELGIVLRSYLPVQLSVELAQEAERRGFHSVWVTESMDAKDAYTQMAAIAMSTDRIHVGSGITPIYTRTPVIAVMSMLALAELSKERAILGLGTGHPIGVEGGHGVKLDRPLTAMREYVEIVAAAARKLPEEMLRSLGVFGQSQQCQRDLAAFEKTRADLLALIPYLPPGADPGQAKIRVRVSSFEPDLEDVTDFLAIWY